MPKQSIPGASEFADFIHTALLIHVILHHPLLWNLDGPQAGHRMYLHLMMLHRPQEEYTVDLWCISTRILPVAGSHASIDAGWICTLVLDGSTWILELRISIWLNLSQLNQGAA